ncbi:MAG: hypothetical protein JRD89_14995 [Deltaproteobacteria bacterium]|nr:hypothetical protein [Deltaproteobacteria bacterium]
MERKNVGPLIICWVWNPLSDQYEFVGLLRQTEMCEAIALCFLRGESKEVKKHGWLERKTLVPLRLWDNLSEQDLASTSGVLHVELA